MPGWGSLIILAACQLTSVCLCEVKLQVSCIPMPHYSRPQPLTGVIQEKTHKLINSQRVGSISLASLRPEWHYLRNTICKCTWWYCALLLLCTLYNLSDLIKVPSFKQIICNIREMHNMKYNFETLPDAHINGPRMLSPYLSNIWAKHNSNWKTFYVTVSIDCPN